HAAQETCDAEWERNEGSNSYWSAALGPFPEGTTVAYQVHAEDNFEAVSTDRYEFRVGPKIYVALMWHMHQPDYRTARSKEGAPVLSLPWVRLHSLRDDYSMPALLLEHHDVHITFNLTPVLLSQIQAYTDESATDRHVELTLTP